MCIKKITDIYRNTNIVIKIVIGIMVGIILAFIYPNFNGINLFGILFVGALKGVAPILVSILIISSLAGYTSKAGKRFKTVILLYLISTLIASMVSVFISFIFPQKLLIVSSNNNTLYVPSGIGEVIYNMLIKIVANPISALTEGNYLGILFWSIITGIVFKKTASESTKNLLSDFSKCVSNVVRLIIDFAPFGIMGLVYRAISSNGIEIFTLYGKMVLLLAGSMLFVYFVTNPIIVYCVLHTNPYPLILKCLKDSGITAFFTRSSAANIPINMALCEKLGLDKDIYSVSIPLGSTINMNGAAVTITIMTLAAVHTLEINVSVPSAIFLSILSTFAACGASGIAGGSLLLIPLACSLFGISNDIAMQVVAVGFVISVIQDSLETALNSSSDVIFTATSEFREWKMEGRQIPVIKINE